MVRTRAEPTRRTREEWGEIGLTWVLVGYQRLLLTARADLCVLIRNLRFVQLELLKKFNLRSDVVILIPLVDHAEPLGLRDPQLSF